VRKTAACTCSLVCSKTGRLAMIKQMTRSGSMVVLLVATLYPSIAAAHAGTDLEVDPCVRWAGESAVHFNAYQPQYELKAQYCTDIPKAGETFLIVDLVDPALRAVPVGLRIVKGNKSNVVEAQTVEVADWHPRHHPTGVISGEVNLDEGLYTVTITAEGRSPSHYQYLLRVQMIDYQKLANSVVVPLLGVLLVAWLGYKFLRSRWLRNRWAGVSS
jgi:hypothetical protein